MAGITPMRLALVGINHKSAPLEVRDKVSLSPEEIAIALETMRKHPAITECLILSTCNRTEILAVFAEDPARPEILTSFLSKWGGVEEEQLAPLTYTVQNEEAVEHIFRVCSGLESMVPGETQIVAQAKDAYTLCCASHCNGALLNRLLHCAFNVSKLVRSTTDIGRGSLSVATLACDLARQALDGLADRTAIVAGMGETGQLAAKHLVERGIGRLLVTNRTLEKAKEAAETLGADYFAFKQLRERIADADIVITAVHPKDYILSRKTIQETRSSQKVKDLVLIDLGVPRNIEPAVAKLGGVRLYNLDDLEDLVDTNRRLRSKERHRAIHIIRDEVQTFLIWYRSHLASPVIGELQSLYDRIRASEVATVQSDLTENQYKQVDAMTKSLVKKLLQHPILHLIDSAKQNDPHEAMRSIRDVFGLSEDD